MLKRKNWNVYSTKWKFKLNLNILSDASVEEIINLAQLLDLEKLQLWRLPPHLQTLITHDVLLTSYREHRVGSPENEICYDRNISTEIKFIQRNISTEIKFIQKLEPSPHGVGVKRWKYDSEGRVYFEKLNFTTTIICLHTEYSQIEHENGLGLLAMPGGSAVLSCSQVLAFRPTQYWFNL